MYSFLCLATIVVTCWERADLLALLYVMFYCVFVTFPYGVLGQVWYLIVSIPALCLLYARIQKVLPERVQLFFIRGKRIQISLKAGHHRPASETPFKWRFAGGPMMAQHWLLAWQLCDFSWVPDQYCYETLCFLWFFRGVRTPAPLWIHTCLLPYLEWSKYQSHYCTHQRIMITHELV